MEVFKLRCELLEKFRKGNIDLTTLTGETFRAIKECRGNDKTPKIGLDKLYLDYLTSLCKLERRVNFEYRLIKSGLEDTEAFKRVAGHYLSEMSKTVVEITNKIEDQKDVLDIALGPKGVVILNLKSSPIGRIYLSRASYLDANISGRPDKNVGHPYLKALFSFL